jgi:hypothetical protein
MAGVFGVSRQIAMFILRPLGIDGFRVPRGGVQISDVVIHMRVCAMLLVIMATAAVPTALGSECFSIQDADQRNACLASAKNDKSYCFKIKSEDLREGCLAPLQGETYGCFKIQDPDARAACLGETKKETWDCFKIQNEDLRKDCIANTPR